MGLAVNSNGYLIADTGNHRIRLVNGAGTITTIAGNGSVGSGGDGGAATSASLTCPMDMVVDSIGNLYVSDPCVHRIRKIDAAGVITTVAGNGTSGFSGDGGPATLASLASPGHLDIDSHGNLYVVDSGNHRVRAVTPAGTIVTVAGAGTPGYSGDGGPAVVAELRTPFGIARNGDDDIFVADSGNNRIRRIGSASVEAPNPIPEPSGYASDGCASGTTLAASTYPNVHVRVGTIAPDPSTRWVCVRADAPLGGVATGGRFVVIGGGSSLPGVPTVDTNVAACATSPGNLVPGPHPAVDVEVGDPSEPATYLPVLLDTYATTSQAWVCVTVGAQQYRVVVPFTVGLTPPTVTFVPDVAGPHITPVGTLPATPSGNCASTWDTRVLDVSSGTTRAFLYKSEPPSGPISLCVRVEGPVSVGGVLRVDTSGSGGVVPVVQTSTTDMSPCTLQVTSVGSPADIEVRRSATGAFPASVCVRVGTAWNRVTVGPGPGTEPADVTWTPDTGTPGLP